ncbi:aliphatic nitrilase [Fusarium coicis]|nr:aliphatic nitrilase [Fusarium coicis]
MPSKCKVAAIQAESCWNDLKGSIAKTIGLIREAAGEGANVIGFPEIFIPGYPWTIWANSPVSNAAFMSEYIANSLEKESDERYQGTLYISLSFIDETGTIVLHRRKIKPTHVERAYWGDGQADSVKAVVPTSFGNIGGLNCWEHTQPLLRYYQYSQNLDIQVSSWPLCWDALRGHGDGRRLFCLGLLTGLTEESKAKTGLEKFDYARAPGGGFSMIYGPDGSELCKPLGPGEEGILYADIDLSFRA